MTKVTLDIDTFKALASDTRLDILKALDGKKMSLKDISTVTKLNKATLHEHLTKLNEAGLVKKKEREGHKFVAYKLTWKGESLLHPENTRIVVMFTTTFIALAVGIIQMSWYVKGTIITFGQNALTKGDQLCGAADSCHTLPPIYGGGESTVNNIPNVPPYVPDILKDFLINKGYPSSPDKGEALANGGSNEVIQTFYQNPLFLYIAIACFVIFTIVLCFSLWRLWKNKTSKI